MLDLALSGQLVAILLIVLHLRQENNNCHYTHIVNVVSLYILDPPHYQ